MFSEKLGGIYSALEEKYYAVLDFLDAKGVPVYAYNDALEERGLPAFPITIALMVILIAGIYGIVFAGTGLNPAIEISFEDQFNESVSGVAVTVKDSFGTVLFGPEKITNGETIRPQRIPIGTEIVIVSEKLGFDESEKRITVKRNEISTSIQMQRQISAIDSKVQLLDQATGDPVRGASVSLEWQGSTKNAVSDNEGKASFAGVPENTEVFLTVLADGYETLSASYSFKENELKGISLVGNSASFLGNSNIVVSVFDETGQPISGAKIVVMDRETDTSIDERTIEGNEAIFSIARGSSIRLVVEKDGFLRYDSMEFDEGRTLRQDEELWPVTLNVGGTRLAVSIFVGQNPLSDAIIQLFDVNGNFVGMKTTGFGGSVEFNGLEPKEYFATGYKQGFLPMWKKINVAEIENTSLFIESADNSNSSYLGISVLDSFKSMANNADVTFKERIEGSEYPLGIPSIKTDISGYASIVAKTGTMVIVEAKKEGEEGIGEKLIEANKDNQLIIELTKPFGIVKLEVFDAQGNKAAGHIVIESVSGTLLFDGNLFDGSVFFDNEGNTEAVVNIETDSGKTFSQRINVQGQETAVINLGEISTKITPTIEFVGIFDSENFPVEGIAKGEDYWLAFQSTWPTGVEKGGVHVRIGADGIAFVDSQEEWVTGFEATTSNYFYGKSYQPLPAPGNETADMQNSGIAGQENKFVELYFEEPENTVAFRVKVSSNYLISKDSIELHYRAWTEAGGKIFREPTDTELGEKMFTDTKTGLYANTINEQIQVFAAKPECENELCGAYFFVLPNGLYIDKQDFKAVTDELYALEIDLSSNKPLSVTLKLDTDKALPKLQFTGYDVDEFVDQQEGELMPPETDLSGQGYLEVGEVNWELQESTNPLGFTQGGESTSLTISALGVSPERPRKVRVYFKAVGEGSAEIKMQAIGESVLDESFIFEIERNKPLLVRITPSSPQIGEAFTVKVLDGEDGSAVQEAVVQVKDSAGKIVASVIGKGSTRHGLSGEYYFRNSLDPGFYTIHTTAAGYKEEQAELTIARDGILEVKSPLKIDVSKDSGEQTISLSIRNTGEEPVTELTYEIEKGDDFPEEFSVSVTMPAEIGKGQDGTATVRVLVNLDEDSEESLYGEADLVVKGMVSENYPTSNITKLQINYNKQLDEGCLYFDIEHLMIRLIGRAGSTGTGEIEVENRCGTALDLRASSEAKYQDPNLTVTVPTLRIEKDETVKVTVSVSNRIERMNSLNERHDYTLKFESSQIAKTIPVTVELSNPRTNLSYPPNIALWMVRNAQEELAYAQAPMQIINNSQIPVTGFRAVARPEQYNAGITFDIRPEERYGINLFPGQPMAPQRFVYAETKQTEAFQKPGQGYVQLSGNVEGRIQPNLGLIRLSANYSGIKCLKASFVDSSEFSSTEAGKGTLERAIKIRNECGEPVRITGITKPEKISGNTFAISPGITLNPGVEGNFKLILLKSQETKTTGAIKMVGLLVNQGKYIESNELSVTLKLGELAATAEGKHTAEISIKKCDSDSSERIAFPVLSSDCTAGYCDAEQLATFLTNKAETLVKTAKEKARRADFSAEGFGNCSQPEKEYCSFVDMGIISETFPVFLQLDNMTKEVMFKALRESKEEIKDYDVLQGTKSIENIGGVGFDFGNINLGGNFKGCGKYYVELIGAARIHNGEIIVSKNTKDFWISINVIQERVTTDECLHNIENAANFLPVDDGFTIKEHYFAWPGFVQAGTEFGDLGKIFAQELFGDAEGRYRDNISSGSNRIEIVKGDVGEGLLKVRISKSGDPEVPKTIYAHVPAGYSEDNKIVEDEIAKAFKSFQKRSFSNKDCIGEDDSGQYIVMKSYSDPDKLYGKLEIKGGNSLKISTGERCTDFNVTSKTSESVMFETDFLTKGKNPSKNGIEHVAIKNTKGEILLEEKANKNKKELQQLRLVKDDKGTYTAQAQFCIKGNSMFTQAAENIKDISITAKSIIGTTELDRKTTPHKIAIEACGMHPYDLIPKMGEVKVGKGEGEKEKLVAYVTINWSVEDGDPNVINITTIQRGIAAEAAMDEARKMYGSGTDLPVAEQPAYIRETSMNKLLGIWTGYFPACMITSIISNIVMKMGGGLFGIPLDVTLDCFLPASWASRDAVKDIGGGGKSIVESIENFVKDYLPFGESFVDSTGNSTLVPENKQAAEALAKNEFREDIVPAAVLGTTLDSLKLGVRNGNQIIGEISTSLASKNIGETVFRELKSGSLKDLTTADPALVKEMQDVYIKELKKSMMARKVGRTKTINDIALESSQEAYAKMGNEMGEKIIKSANNLGTGAAGSLKEIETKIASSFMDEDAVVKASKFGISPELGSETIPNTPRYKVVVKNRITKYENGVKDMFENNIKKSLKDQFGTDAAGNNIYDKFYEITPATPESTKFTKIINDAIDEGKKGIIAKQDGALTPIKIGGGQWNAEKITDWEFNAKITTNLDDAARETVASVRKEGAEFIAENVVGKKVGQEIAEKLFTGDARRGVTGIADEVIDTRKGVGGLTKIRTFFTGSNLRRFINLATTWNLVKNLAKGVASGVASNYMGYQGWKVYWGIFGEDEVKGAITSSVGPRPGEDIDGDGIIDDVDGLPARQELERGQTYKIIITATDSGRKHEFVKLEKKEDFEKMDKEIAEGKAELWEEPGCKNFKDKGVGRYLGNLDPVPSKTVKPEHVTAYYNYNSEFADAKRGDASSVGDDLYEDELAAALFVDPGRIEECTISKTWYLQRQGETKEDAKLRAVESINCAAGELRQAKLRAGAGASFKNVAAELVKGQEGAANYSALALEFQEIWERFRIIKAN